MTTRRSREFNTIYQRWHEGDVDVPMPGGETASQVLHRYLPVITQLRLRYLDDDAFDGDIVMVSHGAAIRLASAVLAGVDGSFALDHHLGNTEAVVLAPITDGRWSCVHWGTLTPPFYPEPDVHPVEDALAVSRPDGLIRPTAHRSCSRSLAVDAERVHHLGCRRSPPRCIRSDPTRGERRCRGSARPPPDSRGTGCFAPRVRSCAHGPFIALGGR